MRYFKYLTTLAGICLLSHNVPADDYDFRKTRWGMPIVQVRAIENLNNQWEFSSEQSAQNSISKTLIVYTGRIFNYKCTLVYQFTHERLSEGAYDFNIKNLDPEIVGELYFKIGKSLTDKYDKGIQLTKGNIGLKWLTADKRTEIVLQFNEIHESIQVMYFSRVNESSNNTTTAEDPF